MTSTVPAVWAGIVTSIRVSLWTISPVTRVPPKVTEAVPETVEKLRPVMETETAPLVGPDVRDKLEITGRSWL